MTEAPRTEANARLTSLVGMVLFVVLAVQGVTILRVRSLITAHVVIGFALLGPVVLKLGTTGWRFLRYYTGDVDYGRAGPPRPLLRMVAPIVVLTTIAVFASGVGLVAVRPGDRSWLLMAHKASFVVWFGAMTVHVLGHLTRAISRSWADVRGRGSAVVLAGCGRRHVVVGISLIAGVVLGAVTLSLAHPWATWFASGHGGDH